MPPGWIRDLYAYWQWLEQQVLESGGYLAGSGYIEPDAYYPTEDPDDDIELLDIRDHRLIFHSGHFLKFTLTTNSAIEEVFYEYHFAEIGVDRGTIWRACNNGHRVEALESETHVHIGADLVVPAPAIEFTDAIKAVHDRVPPGLN